MPDDPDLIPVAEPGRADAGDARVRLLLPLPLRRRGILEDADIEDEDRRMEG